MTWHTTSGSGLSATKKKLSSLPLLLAERAVDAARALRGHLSHRAYPEFARDGALRVSGWLRVGRVLDARSRR